MKKLTDKHSYSFFGQKVGIIVQSSSKSEPFIFFKLIKAKNDGTWEKPSKGEGKTIKFSIGEMACILRVLTNKTNTWSSYHSYKDNKTQISFKWEEGEKGKLWIHITPYSKVLDYSQSKIMEMLLAHILEEKIEFATIGFVKIVKNKEVSNSLVDVGDNLKIVEEHIGANASGNKNSETRRFKGEIKGDTEKGILIKLTSGEEQWFPKSSVHTIDDEPQLFDIDLWVLKKNKIVT